MTQLQKRVITNSAIISIIVYGTLLIMFYNNINTVTYLIFTMFVLFEIQNDIDLILNDKYETDESYLKMSFIAILTTTVSYLSLMSYDISYIGYVFIPILYNLYISDHKLYDRLTYLVWTITYIMGVIALSGGLSLILTLIMATFHVLVSDNLDSGDDVKLTLNTITTFQLITLVFVSIYVTFSQHQDGVTNGLIVIPFVLIIIVGQINRVRIMQKG